MNRHDRINAQRLRDWRRHRKKQDHKRKLEYSALTRAEDKIRARDRDEKHNVIIELIAIILIWIAIFIAALAAAIGLVVAAAWVCEKIFHVQ